MGFAGFKGFMNNGNGNGGDGERVDDGRVVEVIPETEGAPEAATGPAGSPVLEPVSHPDVSAGARVLHMSRSHAQGALAGLLAVGAVASGVLTVGAADVTPPATAPDVQATATPTTSTAEAAAGMPGVPGLDAVTATQVVTAALRAQSEPGAQPSARIVAAPVDGVIPGRMVEAYRRGEQVAAQRVPQCNLPWWLLAGIGRVESGHAANGAVDANGMTVTRILGPRLDGTTPNTAVITDTDGGRFDGDAIYDRAVGPMQFIPGTWMPTGVDGNGDGRADPSQVDDAAASAAIYLCAGGGDMTNPSDMSAAILRYNYSQQYVADVLAGAVAYRDGRVPVTPPRIVKGAPEKPVVSATPVVRKAPEAESRAAATPEPRASTKAAPTPRTSGKAASARIMAGSPAPAKGAPEAESRAATPATEAVASARTAPTPRTSGKAASAPSASASPSAPVTKAPAPTATQKPTVTVTKAPASVSPSAPVTKAPAPTATQEPTVTEKPSVTGKPDPVVTKAPAETKPPTSATTGTKEFPTPVDSDSGKPLPVPECRPDPDLEPAEKSAPEKSAPEETAAEKSAVEETAAEETGAAAATPTPSVTWDWKNDPRLTKLDICPAPAKEAKADTASVGTTTTPAPAATAKD